MLGTGGTGHTLWFCTVLLNLTVVVLCCCVRHFVTPWTEVHQAPLSMEFSRQEYWSRLPLPSPGDLSDPGIEPTSLMSLVVAGGFFTTAAHLGSPKMALKMKFI